MACLATRSPARANRQASKPNALLHCSPESGDACAAAPQHHALHRRRPRGQPLSVELQQGRQKGSERRQWASSRRQKARRVAYIKPVTCSLFTTAGKTRGAGLKYCNAILPSVVLSAAAAKRRHRPAGAAPSAARLGPHPRTVAIRSYCDPARSQAVVADAGPASSRAEEVSDKWGVHWPLPRFPGFCPRC